MKFLVLTDLHQKRSAIDWINSLIKKYSVGATLFLGDVTDFGSVDDAKAIFKLIDGEVYALPGNCDPPTCPEAVSDIVQDMHGKSVTIGNIYIAGLGGSNPTIFDTPFELSEEEIMSKLDPISKNGMVLMVHAPPFGINDTIPSGLHVGSKSILEIVKKYRPIAVLSGHIHEAIGTQTVDGTLFVNPGPARDGMSAILTIEDGKASVQMLGPLS